MAMLIKDLLKNKKTELLAQWEDYVLGNYEPDTFAIFKNKKDQFANPVGHKIRVGLEELYEVICDESDREIETPVLGQLIKLRAVQDEPPSQTVSFLFKFKELVRNQWQKGKIEMPIDQWLAFDARVDAAALAVFDIFMASREQLYQVRLKDIKASRDIITSNAVCPSALMRKNREEREAAAAGDEAESF